MSEKTDKEAFVRYLGTRFLQADAITPGQKIEVIQDLRHETHELGRVPLSGGPVRVDVSNEAVQAALHGRAVSVDGKTMKTQKTAVTSAEGLASLGAGMKIVIMVGILLVPLVIVFVVLVVRAGDDDESAESEMTTEVSSETLLAGVDEPTATPAPLPTSTPAPTETPAPPPTLPPPQIIVVTPTPFPALQINERGRVADLGNDPASLEVAGFAYILTTGSVSNGLWEPRGAEWLQGTELRRVITVPYAEDLLTALFDMSAKEMIKLRLRSGEIVDYRLAEVARVGQAEIEALSAQYPSIAVVLYGEEQTDTRWVVIGEAVQEAEDFSEYGRLPAPVFPVNESNFTIVEGPDVTIEDLSLTISSCETLDEIDGKTPPGRNQRFVTCTLKLEAVTNIESTTEAVALTELTWADSAQSWLPFQTIQTTDLHPGAVVDITVSGIVNQSSELAGISQPVLLWKRADVVYLVTLETVLE